MEKENKTLGTERCENILTLYINKFIFRDHVEGKISKYG